MGGRGVDSKTDEGCSGDAQDGILMNLYVWEDVLQDRTPGVIFAYAKNLRQARRLVLKIYDGNRVKEAIRDRPELIREPSAWIYSGGS